MKQRNITMKFSFPSQREILDFLEHITPLPEPMNNKGIVELIKDTRSLDKIDDKYKLLDYSHFDENETVTSIMLQHKTAIVLSNNKEIEDAFTYFSRAAKNIPPSSERLEFYRIVCACSYLYLTESPKEIETFTEGEISNATEKALLNAKHLLNYIKKYKTQLAFFEDTAYNPYSSLASDLDYFTQNITKDLKPHKRTLPHTASLQRFIERMYFLINQHINTNHVSIITRVLMALGDKTIKHNQDPKDYIRKRLRNVKKI